jgi:phage baseplate assembly protein W
MANTTVSTFVRTFKDLDLNFTIHPVKKDINKRFDEVAITNSVKNLILTNFYERPFHPTTGSNVRRLLFDNVDFLTASLLERDINDCIVNFEPRVQVYKIDVQPDPDNNRYKVTLQYFIINITTPITVSFYLERVR